jgi:phage shock protein PspC (stress-responsive transcriptional regulator)
MKKTISINLAGFFFHIDEDAYNDLQNYLAAVKRSMQNEQGTAEIIADIEARIAELFSERISSSQQVITSKIVEDIINIMGQPEDYNIDDDNQNTTTDEYSNNSTKRLFRDKENAFVGGVSAGLGHYLGVDALWIRLTWILLIFGLGTGVLLYLIMWCLIPSAKTTAEKLSMMGKSINITNIEEQVKEGFGNVKEHLDKVTEKVKQQDFNALQNKSRSFFEALSSFLSVLFKLFIKVIGIILITFGVFAIITTTISFFTLGIFGVTVPGIEMESLLNSPIIPLWLVSIIVTIVLIIPPLFIVLLGLRLLKTKSIFLNKTARISLLVLWIIAVSCLIALSLQQLVDFNEKAYVTKINELPITKNDTLFLEMSKNSKYTKLTYRDLFKSDEFKVLRDNNQNQLIYGSNIRLIVRSTNDSLATISVEKSSRGKSYELAKERAENVKYGYNFENNTLQLDPYFTTDMAYKIREQSIEVIVTLPKNAVLFANKNTYSFHRNYDKHQDLLKNGEEEHFLKVKSNTLECLDCNH